MSHKIKKDLKRKRNSNQSDNDIGNNFNNDNNEKESAYNNNTATISWDKISDEDKQSICLLIIQLRSIVTDLCAYALIWQATMKGIQYILERYDSIEGNEHTTDLEPDILVLNGLYIALISKLMNTYVSFTRYNIVTNKLAQGTYKYSSLPNYYINVANILNLLVSYYRIEATKILVARDTSQPIYGV
ncbi:hypothetical protein [Clostridium sp. SM-530-WT-3G]|uniref:hypothetical protein n=1 Tax=Clostridium sp. SM-530-WT-3G TaxID=2725303 RepID=UPI00145CB3B1|nr:hypothetical protein [Clostridium sp. SM-530-WT-3G]NME81546.1 hypothetical protein [Clostridium sp. SM-530-WT-3G]